MIQQHDPFTIAIIQSGFQAICDEMSSSLRRTAMSSIIYEALDFGVGLTDASGELVCDGAGLPVFVGILQNAVRSMIDKFGDNVRPGDMFLVNEPTGGGTHLNDVVAVKPVFAGQTLVAWVAAKAHWGDIGGMVPGGMSPDATETVQEGLILPGVKLYDGDRMVEAVHDIIAANSRTPKWTLGDMWAMVSAVRLGADRVGELATRYGTDGVTKALEDLIALGERTTLEGLRALPAGVYHAEDFLDDGRKLQCTVTISPTEFIVDLRGNPEQGPNAFNNPLISTYVCAGLVLKAITNPTSVANGGSFRAMKLLTDKGSIFDPHPDAAVGLYILPSVYVTELVWKAVAHLSPERMAAGHMASINGIAMFATHPERNQRIMMATPDVGGWGASYDRDGQSASGIFGNGDARNSPAEICEARNGIRVDRYEFHEEPGGEGKFRGGRGICVEYVARAADTILADVIQTRTHYAPWPLAGGNEGSLNRSEVERANGEKISGVPLSQIPLGPGDKVRVWTSHGAGYGNPRERDPKQVREDIEDGLITLERAGGVYGYAE
ncbi:hydantoinase B/oxoprolinase family protein [Pseudomonas sp. LFM046]|uniref:hydantoinase B/oxoprolinase family protein n=1 Tax=Pseudomonas sp. LFM046 TaxID=1608357 RepID=UPI0005CFA1E3|nr:hydantoinase B/oxoprolinase family protein [Pseudomonas sp. LFM046]